MKNYFPIVFFLLFVFSSNAFAETGCTLLLDNTSGKIVSRNGAECEKRYSPASTFKVALALMGYDSGLLVDEHNPAFPFEEGYTVNKEDDRQTTDPTLWEKNSVVWYSQKLTTALGMKKFQYYVNLLNYGNKDLSGDTGKNNGLTHAWLGSSLKISAAEEANFIRNILNHKFKISEKSYEMTENIIPEFDAEDGWKVHGKTGSSGVQGWFVGWAEKDGRKIAFAKFIIADKADSGPYGPKARDEFLKEIAQTVR